MKLFERKLYSELIAWKRDSNGASAMLVEGARRTGKTTLVKEFARREYDSFLYIDFSHVDKQVLDIFRDYRSDTQTLLRMLQLFYGVELHERKSLVVFDEVQLARRMKAVRAIVPEDIRLCYSIKANPFLIPAMRRLVGTLEVCSPGELEICRQQGVSPDMVLFSGVNKTRADVERAMDLGVTRCESPLHVRLIDEAARSRGRVYPVLLRLTAGSQFGMDERDFFAALDHRAATPGIRIEGVHYFSGTQRKKLDGQRKELAMLCALADRLKAEYGMETVRVEYGPGLYFPYFSH